MLKNVEKEKVYKFQRFELTEELKVESLTESEIMKVGTVYCVFGEWAMWETSTNKMQSHDYNVYEVISLESFVRHVLWLKKHFVTWAYEDKINFIFMQISQINEFQEQLFLRSTKNYKSEKYMITFCKKFFNSLGIKYIEKTNHREDKNA